MQTARKPTMNRTPEQWAAIKPAAFLTGSIAQAANVIEMMQADIATQARLIDRLKQDVADEREEASEQRRSGGNYWGDMLAEDA